MISLQSLITLAPFSEEMKQKLLKELPTLSEGKQFELTRLCWSTIIQKADLQIQQDREQMLLEVGLKKREYSEEEMQKIEENVYSALAQKIQEVSDKSSLEDVKDKLEEIRKEVSENKTSH